MNKKPILLECTRAVFIETAKWINSPAGQGRDMGETMVVCAIVADPNHTTDNVAQALTLARIYGTKIVVID